MLRIERTENMLGATPVKRRRRAEIAMIVCIVLVMLTAAVYAFTFTPPETVAATYATPTIAPTAPPATPTTMATPTPAAPWVEYRLTAYCACEKCCEKSPSDPLYGITASGTVATEGRTVAADPRYLPYGTVIEIEGVGLRTVEDCGGGIKGDRLDLYFEDHSTALIFGRQTLRVRVVSWG